MPATALAAKTIYTPDPIADGVVVFDEDRIVAVGARQDIELPARANEVRIAAGSVVPGFIDIHNHGAGGRDVMEADGAALDTICRTLARFGTTSFYPTTLTAPGDHILRAVEFLGEYVKNAGQAPSGATQPLGIHMEGPYLNEKRRGVHPAEHIAEPTLAAYRRFAEAAQGQLRIMTIAPERAGAEQVIAEMLATGVRPSMGHSDATYPEAERAVQLGVRQVTHMFNAMRPFAHRDPGIIAKVLMDPAVKAELIADGVHVDPKAMELLYRSKGCDGIVLVSDGLSAVGMPEGEYFVARLPVRVEGGACRYHGTLAGSVLTLDRAIRNMRHLVGVPLAVAIRMATLNTARLMGIDSRKGCLKPGADADLVVVGSDFAVQQVYLRGVLLE